MNRRKSKRPQKWLIVSESRECYQNKDKTGLYIALNTHDQTLQVGYWVAGSLPETSMALSAEDLDKLLGRLN